jgi:hypothetical protein|tara:strand:+ start:1507 stop:1779 length:273 start_codon:yes stop_codon:yes gene_type:complete
MAMSPKQQMEMDKKWRQYRLENVLNEEEKDAFDAPIPSQIKRFMTKFIDALQKGNLNRKRKLAILGQVVANLGIEPNELMKYVRLVKKGL